MANQINFEIEETIGILSTNKSGWTKELNLISWNGRPPKFDLRDWAPDHAKMGKGITLTNEEVASLREILVGMVNE
ncbi:YdbC family protein [Loigolactobacillus iwatensis]|uniref:YdbC family protein n=1 Tax=Loigolactobacillus iwatensis TaxID=1267156 RepID=UPI000F7E4206|nr:YdbC family protein [Loigolactobacillus iwatensis]